MKVTRRQAKEIEALKRLRDEQIDLTDIPLVRDWDSSVIGKFYRPRKKLLTIRIDADVLAWLRGQGKGYQTRIYALLRDAMGGQSSAPNRVPLIESRRRSRRRQIAARKLRRNSRRVSWAAAAASE